MNEYLNQAKNFLEECGATMTIAYCCKDINKNWNDIEARNTYRVRISTPNGTMSVKFWDSINNTRNGNRPNEYDILACLQKYDVGSFEDFASEFGYDISEAEERRKVKRIYASVCEEYKKIGRCFTEEQIEKMREIQQIITRTKQSDWRYNDENIYCR